MNIERAKLAKMFDKAESFVLIINATHERGLRQELALAEMNARGLWLNNDQKRQAGLVA